MYLLKIIESKSIFRSEGFRGTYCENKNTISMSDYQKMILIYNHILKFR